MADTITENQTIFFQPGSLIYKTSPVISTLVITMNQALYRHPYSPRTHILLKISSSRRSKVRRRSPTSRSVVEKDSRRIAEESEEAEEEEEKNTRNPYISPTSTPEVTGAKTWLVRRQTYLDTTGVSTHNRLAEACQYSGGQSEVQTDTQQGNHADTQSRAYGHVYSIEFTHIL